MMRLLFESRRPVLKDILVYLLLLLVFGAGTWLTLQLGARYHGLRPVAAATGESLPFNPSTPRTDAPETTPHDDGGTPREHPRDPLSTILLQIAVILFAAKVFGGLSQKLGSPAVIGEMAAGIALGPSVLGAWFPVASAHLFPASSLDALRLLSQIGVIIYMFVVGVDLNARHLRERAHAAVIVSHAGIVVPFFLGVALSTMIYRSLAAPDIPFTAFALFMGVAMSITAFPVLSRII